MAVDGGAEASRQAIGKGVHVHGKGQTQLRARCLKAQPRQFEPRAVHAEGPSQLVNGQTALFVEGSLTDDEVEL